MYPHYCNLTSIFQWTKTSVTIYENAYIQNYLINTTTDKFYKCSVQYLGNLEFVIYVTQQILEMSSIIY